MTRALYQMREKDLDKLLQDIYKNAARVKKKIIFHNTITLTKMKDLYEDYLQATMNFLNLLESTTKIEIKNKKDYSRAFNLWCDMGKPKKNDSQYILKKKALSRRVEDAQRHREKQGTDSKSLQRIDRDKLPMFWEDLLK